MNKKLLIVSLVSLFLFIIILLAVNFNYFSIIDNSISSSIPSIQNPFLTEIAKALDLVFDTSVIIVISLIIAACLFLTSKKDSLFFAVVMLANSAIVYFMKEIVVRARPENSLIASKDLSFPSGHTTTAIVFFGLLIYLAVKYRSKNLKINITFAVIMMIIIALSRIYLNVHWFSDILASIFLGLFVLSTSILIRKFC